MNVDKMKSTHTASNAISIMKYSANMAIYQRAETKIIRGICESKETVG